MHAWLRVRMEHFYILYPKKLSIFVQMLQCDYVHKYVTVHIHSFLYVEFHM